jgi:hypothetical protein
VIELSKLRRVESDSAADFAINAQCHLAVFEGDNRSPDYDDEIYPSPSMRGRAERSVRPDQWHHEAIVLASSQLMRRSDRAAELWTAEDWDIVVLDEAHHARRKSPGAAREHGTNSLLRLMRRLKGKTKGLLLLTATPMQVHPVEVWDLLNLLGLPPEWTDTAFVPV